MGSNEGGAVGAVGLGAVRVGAVGMGAMKVGRSERVGGSEGAGCEGGAQ